MSEIDHPAFHHLATEGDESRWLADEAALRRAAAARQARGWAPSASDRRVADAPVKARVSPALIGGGLALAAAVILIAAVLLRSTGPAPVTPKAAPTPARSQAASAPVIAGASLPCYVGGVSLGVLPLVDCAAREGREMDRLRAERDRRSRRVVLGAETSRHAGGDRVTALKLWAPSRARPVRSLASSTRVVSRRSRLDAPPRTAAAPPSKSAPFHRLEDVTFAIAGTPREASLGARPARSLVSSTRVVSRRSRLHAPPRAAAPPPVGKSAPFRRLEDVTLATAHVADAPF